MKGHVSASIRPLYNSWPFPAPLLQKALMHSLWPRRCKSNIWPQILSSCTMMHVCVWVCVCRRKREREHSRSYVGLKQTQKEGKYMREINKEEEITSVQIYKRLFVLSQLITNKIQLWFKLHSVCESLCICLDQKSDSYIISYIVYCPFAFLCVSGFQCIIVSLGQLYEFAWSKLNKGELQPLCLPEKWPQNSKWYGLQLKWMGGGASVMA